ncbi:MAG TPA: hypothetical protein VFH31_16635 [Pyrinomonadaceae bacterium]|nr:hypothetical protein [Pyrinomonadaceae bacterium]
MPYPFAPLPTFAELKRILEEEFGCDFKQDLLIFNERSQDTYSITYFERDMGGEVLDCVVIFPEDENERLQLTLLRSIIHSLKLDPGRFGLDLDNFE